MRLVAAVAILLAATTAHAYYGEPEPKTELWPFLLAGWLWFSTSSMVAWGGSRKGYNPAAVFFGCVVATPLAMWMGLLLAPQGSWRPASKVPAYMGDYADVRG